MKSKVLGWSEEENLDHSVKNTDPVVVTPGRNTGLKIFLFGVLVLKKAMHTALHGLSDLADPAERNSTRQLSGVLQTDLSLSTRGVKELHRENSVVKN